MMDLECQRSLNLKDPRKWVAKGSILSTMLREESLLM